MAQKFIEVQKQIVKDYNIKLIEFSNDWGRMHANIKRREVHKWHPKNSAAATFDLFHEIGHIETTKSSMRRAEEEYYATKWAMEKFKEYGLKIPERCVFIYQRYIIEELYRGIRRGGQMHPEYNLYTLMGVEKDFDQCMSEYSDKWRNYILGYGYHE